jgi:hypothetical protein
MTVTMSMQEILATIQRNQQQIDLLTANNTQLVHFLLSQGMIQNLSELPELNGHALPGGMATLHGPSIAAPLLPAPTEPSARKARKPVTRKAAKRRDVGHQAAAATSNAGRGHLQAELLIAWARQAGGTLKLAQFRAANEGKTRGIKNSFYTTTMYTKVGKLTEQGVFTKIGPGEYRLNDGRG